MNIHLLAQFSLNQLKYQREFLEKQPFDSVEI